MGVQQLFQVPELTAAERQNIALLNTYGIIPAAYEEALERMLWFMNCGEEPRGEAPPERLLDWDADFMALWGDFKVYAGVDLRRVRFLHWWEFMAMFQSLPQDSQIKNRIHIRSIDLSEYKDPDTREKMRRQKERFALEPLFEDLDDLYGGVM